MHQQKRLARHLAHALLALSAAALAGPGFASPDAAIDAQYKAAIANPARSDDDRQGDAKRKPAEFLAFAKVRPGMKVLDVSAGAGATSALLAAAVGPGGEVWAQAAKPSPKLDARLAAADVQPAPAGRAVRQPGPGRHGGARPGDHQHVLP